MVRKVKRFTPDPREQSLNAFSLFEPVCSRKVQSTMTFSQKPKAISAARDEATKAPEAKRERLVLIDYLSFLCFKLLW